MSRKLYRNQADRFFNIGGDVPTAQPTTSTTSSAATQPTYTRSVDTGSVVNRQTNYSTPTPSATAQHISADVVATSTIPTLDPTTTNVVVVQPAPIGVITSPSLMVRGGGGSVSPGETKPTAVAKDSLIKTYLLPLLIIGAGVYVYFKKPIKN